MSTSVHQPVWWDICMFVCMSICLLIHLYIIITFEHLSVCSFLCQYFYLSISTILSNIVNLHPWQVAWETNSDQIWYLGIPYVVGFIYRWDIFTLGVCLDMPNDVFVSLTSRKHLPGGIISPYPLIGVLSQAIGSQYSGYFACSMLLIMPQVTVTTTTPLVMVVCSRAMPISTMITLGPTSVGQTTSAWYGSATKVDSKRHNEGFCWPHLYATALKTSVPDALSGICQLCHGSSTCKFFFQNWTSHRILMSCVGFCCGLLSYLRIPCGCHVHQWELNCWGLWPQPFRIYPSQAFLSPGDGSCPSLECTVWLLLPLFWV